MAHSGDVAGEAGGQQKVEDVVVAELGAQAAAEYQDAIEGGEEVERHAGVAAVGPAV